MPESTTPAPAASAPIAPALDNPPRLASAAPGASRAVCALGALFWVVMFVWLWLPAPALPKILGLAWFALGAAWPAGYFVSLALALPWFGNNPGGGHALYLLDMGLMGLVSAHLAARALGRVAPRPRRLDPWITLLVAWWWVTALNQWPWIRCEFLFQPGQFLYRIYNHYGTADVYGVQLALKLTLVAGLYAVLRDRPWSPERLRRLWWVLQGALVASALAGWLNYAGWLPLAWWRGENQDITRFGYRRLQSLYWHSGWFAQYVEALAPGALALGWLAPRKAVRWTLWTAALFLGLTQLLTMQRAGWIGLAGGCLSVAALVSFTEARRPGLKRLARRLLVPAALMALLVLSAVAASPAFRHRLGELFVYQHRTVIWQSAAILGRSFPATGIGIGNYYHVHTLVFPEGHPFWHLDKVTAHNLYLQLWVETGLFGLALFLAIQGGVLVALARAILKKQGTGDADRTRRALQLGLLGGLVALSLDGLFQYVFYVRTIDLLFWLLVGWAAGLAASGEAAAMRPRRRWPWLLVFLCFAATSCWWKRDLFVPQKTYIEGMNLNPGGKEVRLPLPAGARKVRLQLACGDPDAETSPVTFQIRYDDKLLRELVYRKVRERKEVILDLSGLPQPIMRPLIVTASRTWSPWAYGLRSWPYMTLGVLYLPPEAVNDTPATGTPAGPSR